MKKRNVLLIFIAPIVLALIVSCYFFASDKVIRDEEMVLRAKLIAFETDVGGVNSKVTVSEHVFETSELNSLNEQLRKLELYNDVSKKQSATDNYFEYRLYVSMSKSGEMEIRFNDYSLEVQISKYGEKTDGKFVKFGSLEEHMKIVNAISSSLR